MRIFHVATLADWQEAQRSGRYTTSTRGRTLAEEGFIHASRVEQWQGVLERFYADVEEPLVLLTIDTERLSAPVVEEPVGDSPDTFPHVYGAIETSAVVDVRPLRGAGATTAGRSFSSLFLAEVFRNVLLATLVMGLGVVGALVGIALGGDWQPLAGLVVGVVVGFLVARAVRPRLDARQVRRDTRA